ncbi:zinc finger protein 816-like isoform X2 [Hetaerina americana]|uniref:zinc finger protein 816-like isoform X2 n=1 Tax=Hetaerina americana TaxID=62018 RepID=UPI003A7F17E2
MRDKVDFEVCRLCLNSRGLLMKVFGENSQLQFMLEKTIADLIGIKFGSEIKREINDNAIASDTFDSSAVDLQDDMIIVKEEIDTASGFSVAQKKVVDIPMIASMQGVDSHWSNNDEAGNLDLLEDGESHLSFNEEVDIKNEFDNEISQEGGCLQADLSQEQEGGKEQDGQNIWHKCQICNERFAQKDILEAHVTLLHPVKAEKIRSGIDAEALKCTSDFKADVMMYRYKCAICSRTFSQRDKLKSHMITHTEEKHFKRDIRAKTHNLKQHLKDQIPMHAMEKSHKCEICSEVFTLKQQLMEHRLTHSGARPHQCDLCSKSFSQKAHLQRHMLVHTGERPHKCEICLKGFHHKQNLECHMLSHTGEKPYKCEVCPKTFTLKHHLKDHVRIHAGEKPFKCEVCSKAFRHKQNLNEHMSNHRVGPQQCIVCSRAFTHSGSLKRHMKVHVDINRIPTNNYMTANSLP